METKSGPRGQSLSTCCRQELFHLLWSPPAFCNRLTSALITCKLYLSLLPAGCSSTRGRSRPECCQSAELATGVIQALVLQHRTAGGQLDSLRSLCLGCSHLTGAARDFCQHYIWISLVIEITRFGGRSGH